MTNADRGFSSFWHNATLSDGTFRPKIWFRISSQRTQVPSFISPTSAATISFHILTSPLSENGYRYVLTRKPGRVVLDVPVMHDLLVSSCGTHTIQNAGDHSGVYKESLLEAANIRPKLRPVNLEIDLGVSNLAQNKNQACGIDVVTSTDTP